MAKTGEVITQEQAKEIWKAVDSASDGYWFPLVTVVICFGIVITLLIYIWNQSQKNNVERHKEHEGQIKKLTETVSNLERISERLTTLVERNGRDIEKLSA